jgi:hypothetical protein
MMAMPMPVPVMAPVHLLRFQAARLFGAGDRGTHIRKRWLAAALKRLWRQRRGLQAGGEHGGAGGKSKGDFQKVAAFHDVSLLVDAFDARESLLASR